MTDPLNAMLTASVRRLAASRPEVFRRLGRFQQCVFLISPTDLPFAFRLMPMAKAGRVHVVLKEQEGPFSVKISGKLMTLLGLFDGTVDADSSFFGRDIAMEGATDAALALHNALEAADLRVSDILGLPPQLIPAFERMFANLNTGTRHDFA